jgi:hypothetical protein
MSAVIKPDSASHWYYPDGTGCHKVEMATKPGQYRNTSLTDARKLGLLPSVTNIISLLSKPQLDAWKTERTIEAAYAYFKKNGFDMPIEEAMKQIFIDSQEQTEVARVFGQTMHGAVENFVCTGEEPENPDIIPYFEKFKEWWNAEVEEVYISEKTVVGFGYAGRLDLKAKLRSHGVSICDFKTRKRLSPTAAQKKRGELGKFGTYAEDCMQLVAYEDAEGGLNSLSDPMDATPKTENVISVFIDSVEPSPIGMHVWNDEDKHRYRRAFSSLCHLWQSIKNYDPSEACVAV